MQRHYRGSWRAAPLAAAVCVAALIAVPAIAQTFGPWGAPVSAQQGSDPALNTEFVDGCPIMSNDGLSLYMASSRPGGLGGLDIWVARRATTTAGWGAPVNLGAPVNSAADDFCPTPVRNKGLLFVTKRDEPNGDIYISRQKQTGGWSTPVNLGPDINSASEEWSPAVYRDEADNEILYFSSTRPGGLGGQDIYYSVNFGPAQPAQGLNTSFDDSRPNVRKDGKEIVFDSTRTPSVGLNDIWTAKRATDSGAWNPPTHLPDLSSPLGESRASLSFDGTFMLFGSTRVGGEGLTDIYVTTRTKTGGK